MWITPDEPGVAWITDSVTLDYSGFTGLLRITRITPDYQFALPSGPANYQSCFSLGITADYAGFTWITLDHSGSLQFTPDYFDLLRITPIYFKIRKFQKKKKKMGNVIKDNEARLLNSF